MKGTPDPTQNLVTDVWEILIIVPLVGVSWRGSWDLFTDSHPHHLEVTTEGITSSTPSRAQKAYKQRDAGVQSKKLSAGTETVLCTAEHFSKSHREVAATAFLQKKLSSPPFYR